MFSIGTIFFYNDQTFAVLENVGPEEIKELFRKVFAAIWPEPTTYTSPHDDTIIIAVCHDIKSF